MQAYSEMKAGKWHFRLSLTKLDRITISEILSIINKIHVFEGKYSYSEEHKIIMSLIQEENHTVESIKAIYAALSKLDHILLGAMLISQYDRVKHIKTSLVWFLSNHGLSIEK